MNIQPGYKFRFMIQHDVLSGHSYVAFSGDGQKVDEKVLCKAIVRMKDSLKYKNFTIQTFEPTDTNWLNKIFFSEMNDPNTWDVKPKGE